MRTRDPRVTNTTRLALAALVASAAACHRGDDAIAMDASPPPPDVAPKLCTTSTACEDTQVHACRDGLLAEAIEDCAPAATCSRGRCTTAACAAADRDPSSFEGCSFYALHLDNVTSDDPLPSSLLVTNPGELALTATLQHPVHGAWVDLESASVPPHRSARLPLPSEHYENAGVAQQLGLRLVSDAPVTVVSVQSDDSGAVAARSSGATMLLPEHVLGRRYRLVGYPQLGTPAVLATDGGRKGAGQLVVIATQDRTTVTVTPSKTVTFGPEGGAPPLTGPSFDVVLDDGDYAQIYTSHDGDDLTGTEVAADKPVAVFSGNISTTYGEVAAGLNSPDLAHEQLLPVTTWSKSFVAASLPARTDVCDSLYESGPTSLWRLVADEANTQITFTTPKDVMAPILPRTLDAGESLNLPVPAGVSFAVDATAPIEVMQGMDCEASLSSAVPTDALLDELWFPVLPTFDTLLAVARPVGQPVVLDDVPVDAALFSPAGSGFEVAQVRVDPCPVADVVCTHHLVGKFGVTMRGEDVLASWATTVPTWVCSDLDRATCSQ